MRTINGLSWSFHFEYGWFLEMLGLILHDSLSFSVATFIPDDSFFHSQWWLISLMIPSHSQWWHGLCCRHCRLQEKNVSLSHSSSQVQRSNIAIAANPTLSLCRFQIRNTKQSYPLQSQCLRIADERCARIPQLSGNFACLELRTKLSPCIFSSNFSLISF